ncbi:MAG TPA: c-type cytochrome [Candidatus Rubrimentiphilum sp.]|nr:c-type cytochrome [Candidatus Rubrimentiphilum sp.]
MTLILATAVASAQQTKVPTNGNPLITPAPTKTLAPSFPAHPPIGAIKEGQGLFRDRCASCHGLNLQGSAQGPPLLGTNAGNVDFMLQTGRMPAQFPWEEEFDKPAVFSRAQINALIAYIMSKSTGEKTLPVLVHGGDLRSGRIVYVENCAQCHSATARGESVGYRDLAPSLMDTAPEQIAEAVRMGPDVMPKFGPHVIDEKKMADLVAYISWLQTAKYNPGGLQLSNWGPFSEGFIAWVVGLGLLVLLVRRIGTTE